MVRIVWGVLLVVLGSFVIWQAVDLLAGVQAANDLVAEFSRSLGQSSSKLIDAYSVTNFWNRVLFGIFSLVSGSLLIYFGDIERKAEISFASAQRRAVSDETSQGVDW